MQHRDLPNDLTKVERREVVAVVLQETQWRRGIHRKISPSAAAWLGAKGLNAVISIDYYNLSCEIGYLDDPHGRYMELSVKLAAAGLPSCAHRLLTRQGYTFCYLCGYHPTWWRRLFNKIKRWFVD